MNDEQNELLVTLNQTIFMDKNRPIAKDIDEYISGYDEDVQLLLQKMRAAIHKAAPDATEDIKYALPTFIFHGNLVHFGAFKNHIGFYPSASGVEAFKEELAMFETSRGAIQFPINKPIPFNLVTKIVKFRVHQSLEKAMMKSKSTNSKKSTK
jgi:uncharacterized protein YdhG (YjbR/CyaY superfamily)